MHRHAGTGDARGTRLTDAPPLLRPRDPAADRDVVRELILEAWLRSYAHIFTAEESRALYDGRLEQSASWLGDPPPGGDAMVAESGGVVAGFCRYSMSGGADGDGEVTHLYVHPDHQGRGIGRSLWGAAVAALREGGRRRVIVWTLQRARSPEFYRAVGCHEVGKGVFLVGRHAEPALCFALRLDAAPADV